MKITAHTSFCILKLKHPSEVTRRKTHFGMEGDLRQLGGDGTHRRLAPPDDSRLYKEPRWHRCCMGKTCHPHFPYSFCDLQEYQYTMLRMLSSGGFWNGLPVMLTQFSPVYLSQSVTLFYFSNFYIDYTCFLVTQLFCLLQYVGPVHSGIYSTYIFGYIVI